MSPAENTLVARIREQVDLLHNEEYAYNEFHVYVSGIIEPWVFWRNFEFEFDGDEVLVVRDGPTDECANEGGRGKARDGWTTQPISSVSKSRRLSRGVFPSSPYWSAGRGCRERMNCRICWRPLPTDRPHPSGQDAISTQTWTTLSTGLSGHSADDATG
jgi:hypothetical protein